MPKRVKPLSDVQVRNAKPRDREYKLFDGYGLYLLVTPTGGKLWHFKYRFDGKEKKLTLGPYPAVSLKEARDKRDAARKLLEKTPPVDPGASNRKKAQAIEKECFQAIALEWFERFKQNWTDGHAITIKSRMERDLFPWIGKRPINEIKAPELLAVLRRVEDRGALESAHRIRTIAGQIFRFAVVTGRAERDPSGDLRGALPRPGEKHLPAITEPKEVGALLRAIEGYSGSFVVKCALKLAPLWFVRPGELRHAEWVEIDLEGAVWNIPAEKMKLRQPHVVPLAHQALEILEELRQFTGSSKWVFPSGRSWTRPMSENAITAALRRMGYQQGTVTGHGWRATARTLLDEVLQFPPAIIEHQLGHAVRDPLGRAYNRTQHLEERRRMMQVWADYLDGLKAGAVVVPIRKRG